jgi:hypothetical protein
MKNRLEDAASIRSVLDRYVEGSRRADSNH